MNLTSTLSRVACLSCLLTLAIVLLVAPHAGAQPNDWDHYKVYRVMPNPSIGATVTLRDQWMQSNHHVYTLDWFANPTQKTIEDGTMFPITDPRTHYSWWSISPVPFETVVGAINQFGDHTLTVFQPQFLLNPALKNESGMLPQQNHYKCYDCLGNPVDRQVTLTDQFGVWQTTATIPKYFCNPVEKQVVGGPTYPIVDPNRHYVCYELEPPDPRTFSAQMQDQFIEYGIQMTEGRFLCVPSDKVEPTPTRPETWGRLKILYR